MPHGKGMTDEEMFGAAPAAAAPAQPSGLSDEEMFGAPERIKMTMLESGALGAAQGATLGAADEIEGGVRSGYDVLTGNAPLSKLVETYRDYRDKARTRYDQAYEDNPGVYTAGNIGGGVATAFIPGLGFMNAAKGAGMLGKMYAGAKGGAAAALGMSEADLTKGEFGRAIDDVKTGALTGGIASGALHLGGKALKAITPENAGKKLANVFLNTPEEITETYMKNPQGVLQAPLRHELAREIQESGLDRLKKEVVEGSAESRAILAKEGATYRGGDIARLYTSKAKQLLQESEGVMSDPRKAAAYQWLVDTAKKFRAGIDPKTGKKLPKILSTNRVKNEIQSLDNMIDWDVGAGKFSPVDDIVRKDVRSTIDASLKRKSPAYASQMEQVAKDTRLLDEAANIAKSPQGWSNVFRRLETDQYGAGQIPRATLEQLDQRLGSNFLEKAKLSNAREAFDKSVTNGSMNVNKFSNMAKDIPVIKYLAPILGATVDKYGRKMTMSAVDATIKLNKVLQSEGVQSYVRAVKPIADAAARGNASAALTMQFLQQSNGTSLKELEQ